MLYTYGHINHEFYKFQNYIEHLVTEVWCKADGKFSINKLHPEFISIVEGVNAQLLRIPIREIYGICSNLDQGQRRKLKNGFHRNNSIEDICNGKVTPLLYSEVDTIHPGLKEKLNKFFKNIYAEVPGKAAFRNVCGDMKSYYDKFLTKNDAEKCPFCGISDIMTARLTKRDAFDHYLPKDTYPFNSVNPDNLAPICKTCNTSYKSTRSPVRAEDGSRRKAFYPFAKKAAKLNIEVKLNCVSIRKLQRQEVGLKITNRASQDQVDTWMALFGIEERYIDKLCSKDARTWLEMLLFDFKLNPKTKNKSFAKRLEYFEQNFAEDNNFLKKAYFLACRGLGVF